MSETSPDAKLPNRIQAFERQVLLAPRRRGLGLEIRSDAIEKYRIEN
jgi:hypothetical protein